LHRIIERIKHMGLYAYTLAKWVAIGALIGVVGGIVGSLFHIGVDQGTHLREAHPWILFLLPAAGVLIEMIYRLFHLQGKGTNAIIESVHFGEKVPILLVPAIFISTVLTHLCGGSAGREGAALQIGGGIGFSAGKALHLPEKELPLATLCGMAGLFSALFGTPLTATVFALEVISVGVLYYAGLIPCLTSALTAYWVAGLMGVSPTRFTVVAPEINLYTLIAGIVLAILCAIVSIIFCRGLHAIEHLARKFVKNHFLRPIVGGCIIIALTLLLGTTDYNGAGMQVIQRAIDGQANPWDWIMKLLFTAITIGCCFKGGEVVPSFFVGATFGCWAATLLGFPAGFGAAMGLIGVFCGAVNCPIASAILSVELFGAQGLIFFAIDCTISYFLSGYSGLYSSQTILYSKFRAEFINVHTKE